MRVIFLDIDGVLNRRAAEVERYLYSHPEIDEYIIIDDDRSEFEIPKKKRKE